MAGRAPFGIWLQGTELLQSPFRMEFRMGSFSRHCRSLRCYRRSLRHCRDPWGDHWPCSRRCRLLHNSLNIVKHVKHSKTTWNTCKTLWYIVKHHEPLVKHSEPLVKLCEPLVKYHEPLVKNHETLKTLWNIMKHSPFDAETSALSAVTLVLTRSFWQYRRGVSGDIGDCGVGKTLQMCNRVTNHGDIGLGTFSKPGPSCIIVFRSSPICPRPLGIHFSCARSHLPTATALHFLISRSNAE